MTASLVGYDVVEDDSDDDDPPSGAALSRVRPGAGGRGRGRSTAGRDQVATTPGGDSVALRRFDARAVARGAPEPPVQALGRAAGPHVQAVLDIGTAPNGDPVVVLARLPWSLGELLAARRLSGGEVVTVLVPILQTLTRMHAAGVAHGALGPAAVRFDRLGTPTLTAFDDAVLARGTHDARFEAAVAADLRSAGTLMSSLFGQVGQAVRSGGAAAELLLRASTDGAPTLAGSTAADAAVNALFDWCEPEPLLLPGERPDSGRPSTPGRVIDPVAEPAAPESPLESRGAVPTPGRASARAALSEAAAPHRPAEPSRTAAAVAAAVRRSSIALRRVRARVWATAGAAVLLLVAAIVLLPGHGAQAAGSPHPSSAAAPSGRHVRGDPGRSAAPSARTRGATATVPARLDPAQAATELIARRAGCLAAADRGCLRRVEVAGAPIAVLDEARVAGASKTGTGGAGPAAVDVRSGPAVVRARSGTTAWVGVGRATALIVRQGGDWLLRDVVVPAG